MILMLALSHPVLAQLTKTDIEALQARAVAEGWTFSVGENAATGRPVEHLCGLVLPADWRSGARFDAVKPRGDLPASFDWRDAGGCTPVKDQGSCGSCWAFATVGPLECNIKIKDGVAVDLSEQWLVSCNQDNYGCWGGGFAHSYHQWKTDLCGGIGAVLEEDFPYAGSNLPCNCPYPHQYYIESWAYIGPEPENPDLDALKQAIMDYGPISVAVRATNPMYAYNGGIFNACEDGSLNHAVVLVGWDDAQGDSGVWIMRNSWGEDWGEDGYMRIQYGCSRIGENACYVVYAGAPRLSFAYPVGIPWYAYPSHQATFEVIVSGAYGGVPMSGTGRLHYRIDGGQTVTTAMTELEANHYLATLPVLVCGQTVSFYVSAEEDSTGRIYDPDPADPHEALVISRLEISFEDDFETDKGWTVGGDTPLGEWERGVPAGGGERGDPPTDYDGSGSCYLTENAWGNSDVDEGTTILTSPAIELAGFDGEIRYARWYYNDDPSTGSGSDMDYFESHLSVDSGATWEQMEKSPPYYHGSGGWYEKSFRISEFSSTTGQMQLRFQVSDLYEGDIVEAAVDDVRVTLYKCETGPLTIVTTDPPDWTAGVPYWYRFSASGGLGGVTWSDKNGDLSGTGLALSVDGFLTGTPVAAGPVSFTVAVSDEYDGYDEQVIAFSINPGVTITTAAVPDWTAGCPYGQQMAAAGGTGVITWADKYGNLAACGLTLSPSGLVSGTPLAGAISFVAEATDEAGSADERQFSFTINDSVTIITPSLPPGEIDLPYSQQLAATGGTAPITWSDRDGDLSGTGLTVSSDGVLSGIVTEAGILEFTARVEDVAGSADEQPYEVAIYGPFACGDANGDDHADVGDAVFVITYVFKSGPAPFPPMSGDANCDGSVNVGDAVYVINYVFKGGDPPCCP